MLLTKHTFTKLICLCSISLLIPVSCDFSANAKHIHHSHMNTHFYLKRHHKRFSRAKKHHHFRYNRATLTSVHYLFRQYYHINFTHHATEQLAHQVIGSHNLRFSRIKRAVVHYHYIYPYHRAHIHCHHVYIDFYARPIKRHSKKYYRKLNYDNKLHRASNQGSTFNNILRQQLILNINHTRKHFHVKPLKVTLLMQQTADYRNKKTQYAYEHPTMAFKYEHDLTPTQFKADGDMTDGWMHGMDTHTSGDDYLIHRGYKNLSWGANNGNWMTGKLVEQPDGTMDKYSDETPRGIADNIDDMDINHDDTNNNYNGHRHNELNPIYKYLGVGITYNPKINLGTFNEQFSN